MTAMGLPCGCDGQPGELVGAVRLERNELDGRGKLAKIDGKPRSRMLRMQRLAQYIVAAVNPNAVARNISGRKKREAHNVVPVGVRQEYVEALFSSGAMFPQHAVAEFAHTGTE